jgi:acetone monooxygenase
MLASEAVEAHPAEQPAASFDAIVIGAGIAGMYQLHRLRELGLSAAAGPVIRGPGRIAEGLKTSRKSARLG